MIITLKPKDYEWPNNIPSEYLPQKKPTVTIDEAEVVAAAEKGITWEQLQDYYCVDQETLKRNFYIQYSKAKAQLGILVLDSMVTVAMEGNPIMLKWLSTNWLGMKSSESLTINKEEPNLSELDDKIAKLLKKTQGDQ